jgi:CBS domain-containing protein
MLDLSAKKCTFRYKPRGASCELVSVKEYVSTPVVSLKPGTTVAEAKALIAKTGHQGFPVVTNDRLVGIVTSSDLVFAKTRQKIANLMVTCPVTAKPDDDVVSIAGVMAYHHIHHLPVIDGEHVIGIVTATDMLRACIENIISENVERIFTFFQTLHPGIEIAHTRVNVESLIPTQKLLDPVELQLRDQQFKHGVMYPIVVTKKNHRFYIIDGHHRAYLAYKSGIKEVPAFFIKGELSIVKSAEKLGIKSLDDMMMTEA